MSLTKEQPNIGWIDMLRVIACLLVVFSHSCDPFVAHFDANREMFVTGVMYGSLVRPCVPLFAMITAVLLLPVKPTATLGPFYKKHTHSHSSATTYTTPPPCPTPYAYFLQP